MPNRRFGTVNKFGNTNKFGASTTGAAAFGRTLTIALEVDWNDDALWDGVNEATNRMLSYELRRGREFFFNTSGSGFQPVSAGELRVVLKNTDRRFDPYYSSGSLYSYLQKNQRIRLSIVDESTGTIYPRFFGYIDNIRPAYGKFDTVEIVAYDAIKKLSEINLTSDSVYQTVQYDDQIIEAFRLLHWRDGTNIDTTLSDSMNYHWFRGNSAFSEIQTLTDATFGQLFIADDGRATYKSRISTDTSVLSLTEAGIDREYGIQAPAPREVIKNKITIYARARALQTGVEIWRMTDKPQISTGTASPIWANFNYNSENVPALSITAPVATTDYTANDNSNGSGADRTGNFTFSSTNFATSCKLIPTNSGGAAYITLLKLRGNVITADKYTFAQDSDSTSISNYGERELIIQNDWLQDVNTATDQATLFLGRFKDPRFYPRVKLKRSNIGAQCTPDLFDLVTLGFSSRDISAEMRVGYIEQSWNISDPNVLDTIMYFEPNLAVSSSGAWIFPTTFPATLG